MPGLKYAIIYIAAYGYIFSNADVVHREGKSFLDIFNIIRLNPLARFAVGVQLTFPISAFMPDLGIFGRHSRSHFSQISQHFWSFKPSSTELSTCPSRGVSIEDYLHLMLIDEESCQELFICELSADPNRFMPLSEILLKKLSFKKKVVQHHADVMNTTEYYLLQAAKVGADDNQECHLRYHKCPVGVTSMINMNILWGWQIFSKFFNVKFVGETEANVLDI